MLNILGASQTPLPLKSDYFRIEMWAIPHQLAEYDVLKSDYRIEMQNSSK